MIRIQALDICTRFCCPVRNDTCRAAVTSRLIGQFPSKNSRTVDVAAYHCFDIRLILGLDFGIRVPSSLAGAVESVVGRHATIITPVVHEIDNKFDPIVFGAFDDVVKSLQTVCSSIYLGLLP